MRCGKCGGENNDGAKFCAYCGAPLETGRASENRRMDSTDIQRRPNVPPDSTKKRKKWPWLLCTAVLVIAAAAGGVFVFLENRQEKQYEALLDSGNRYIEELDYEKAEDSYLQAISIDPKQKEPYLKLIDIYIAQEEYDQAAETAEKAKAAVPAEDQKVFEEAIETWGNVIDYTWVVEPEIEADDINYICGLPYQTDDYYLIENDRNAQYMCSYAVLTAEGHTRLIGQDGELLQVDGAVWNDITCSSAGYLISREGGLSAAFDGETLSEWTGGGGVAGINWYYYSDDLYDAETPSGASVTPRAMPVPIPVPVTDGVLADRSQGTPGEWFSEHTTGYLIMNNGELRPNEIYEECGACREGVMAVCIAGKWGYVSTDGEEIVPPEYDSSWTLTEAYTGVQKDYCYAASDGFIPLTKDGQWELRTVDGTTVIPAGIFEAIRPVYNGRCWVKKDGRWGVIQVAEPELTDGGAEETSIPDEASDSEEPAEEETGESIEENSRTEENAHFTEEQLQEISRSLGVPEDLDVEIETGEPTYYEAGERWYITVLIYHEGEMVACANVDIDTLGPINNIYIYSE